MDFTYNLKSILSQLTKGIYSFEGTYLPMLSEQELEMIRNLDDMNPKARGNMLYRIRQKMKASLDDLNEIILALDNMPSKSAQKVVTDEHVAATFALSEKLVDVLGYAPVEVFGGQRYVTRTTEVQTSNQPGVEKRTITTNPASSTDAARVLLVKNHVARLSERIDPRPAHIPSDRMLWTDQMTGSRIGFLDETDQVEEWMVKARKPKV